MGRYCKAYLLSELRRFPAWQEDAAAARPAGEPEAGAQEPPAPLTGDSILYLQEDFSVTDGIFKDEHVIFRADTLEWRRFCTEELGFALPEDLSPEAGAETAAP